MSTHHSQNKDTTKKIKLDKVDEHVSRIAEYKKFAILKFCNKNGINKKQLDKISISNEHCKLSLYCFFSKSLTTIVLKSMKFFFIL